MVYRRSLVLNMHGALLISSRYLGSPLNGCRRQISKSYLLSFQQQSFQDLRMKLTRMQLTTLLFQSPDERRLADDGKRKENLYFDSPNDQMIFHPFSRSVF